MAHSTQIGGVGSLRTTTGPGSTVAYPCLDPATRRYRSFPCSQCEAEGCLFGKKPVVRAKVNLAAGQKACERCGTPYQAYGKSKYCSDECRKKALYKRRKARRQRSLEYVY